MEVQARKFYSQRNMYVFSTICVVHGLITS